MPQVGFQSKLLSDQGAHFIPVPADIVALLGPQKGRPVKVTINGHTFLAMVARSAGRHFVGVRQEVREAAGVRAGDALTVGLEYEAAPEVEDLPDDLQRAIADDAAMRSAFDALPIDRKREVVAWVTEAKRHVTHGRLRAVSGARSGAARCGGSPAAPGA